jgi:hypothetical protein
MHGQRNIKLKTDLEEVGLQGVDWVNLAQDRDSCQAGILEHKGTFVFHSMRRIF